jgi:hypothetical protein
VSTQRAITAHGPPNKKGRQDATPFHLSGSADNACKP